MNYRHIYHAGNRCDVVKHAILTLVLRHLRAKDKGFAVLDTHAGMGLYDLNEARALKTGEADEGIKSLLSDISAATQPVLADYFAVLRKLNILWAGTGSEGFRVYPGSPLLAFHLLREQDRLIACELHPEDAENLRLQAPADPRLQIHRRDGYEALHAFVPLPEKRGLVLIDPPYEQPDEFDALVKHIGAAYRSWPSGIYMIWYPIKDRPAIWKFHEALTASGIDKILCAEFIYDEESRADKLSGSGMIIINPPWKLDEEIGELFSILHRTMKTEREEIFVKWLKET